MPNGPPTPGLSKFAFQAAFSSADMRLRVNWSPVSVSFASTCAMVSVLKSCVFAMIASNVVSDMWLL